MQPSVAATRRVRGWTRLALSAERGISAVSADPTDAGLDAEDLLGAVLRQRVAEVVAPYASTLPLGPAVADGLAQVAAARRALVPLQLLELARVRDVLDAAGIRHLVIKGPALAQQTLGDQGGRGPGDLDLLVDPNSVESVAGLLLTHGWTAPGPLPSSGRWAWRRIVHTSNEQAFLGASCTVDLHWRLDPTLDALPDFAELWSRRVPVEIGGTVAMTLGLRDALAHACLNAARDEWRWLRLLVDVHRLAGLEAAWHGFTPSRLQLRSLAVAEAQVGLPAAVPDAVRDQIGALRPRVVRRDRAAAERAQERPARTLDDAPGSATVPLLRYQISASASPRNVRHAIGTLVLPGRVLGSVDEATAWAGVPVGMGRRIGLLAQSIRSSAMARADREDLR